MSRSRKMMFKSLALLFFSALFAIGVPASAGASANCVPPAPDNQLIVNLVNRLLARAGLLPQGSKYKIAVYYNGVLKTVIPVEEPRPVPQPNTAPAPPQGPAPQPSPQPVPQPATQPDPQPASPEQGLNADEQRMLSLVNAARTGAGLKPLKSDPGLVRLARMKARDMIDNNYFAHTSPTYGSPFDMIRKAGITYRYAGENLAGAPAVDSAHTNLMNSSGHRANIMNTNFSRAGIGVVSGGPYGKMFVQIFTG